MLTVKCKQTRKEAEAEGEQEEGKFNVSHGLQAYATIASAPKPVSAFAVLDDTINKELLEGKLRNLQEENRALRRALELFQKQYAQCGMNRSDVLEQIVGRHAVSEEKKVSHMSAETSVCDGRDHRNTKSGRDDSAGGSIASHHLCAKLHEKMSSGAFLAIVERNRVLLSQGFGEDHNVAVVNLDDEDWWMLVPDSKDPKNLVVPDSASLDGSYVLVEHDDVIDAIADFVVMYMASIPATSGLSDKQLQNILVGAFAELRDKSSVRQLWDWGATLYTAYGWTTTAMGVYRDPELALVVMRGLWTICKWLVLFVV